MPAKLDMVYYWLKFGKLVLLRGGKQCFMFRTIEELRKEFPALAQEFYGKPLVYLDNAATSQKPLSVIELMDKMTRLTNSNVHRAMYRLSDEVTGLYERARDVVVKFINAPGRENIIFTSGTTASINLVARSLSDAPCGFLSEKYSCVGNRCSIDGKFFGKGDVIVFTGDSHHSNLVPWQMAALRTGAEIEYTKLDEDGHWSITQLDTLLARIVESGRRVRLVAITHISNVLGIVNPVKAAVKTAHKYGALALVDGAQGIVHDKIDVIDFNCDFYAFSAHKIYGQTGVGVLYGKKDILEAVPPFMGGGDMVDRVSYEKTTYAPLPLKFEAGTPNFIGAASLAPALEFAMQLRAGEIAIEIEKNEKSVKEYLQKEFSSIEGLKWYGNAPLQKRIALYSISVQGCHPADMAQILDKMGIAVRTGLLCAEPVMNRFGVGVSSGSNTPQGMLRASFAPYNTLAEAEYFIASLKRCIGMLR